MSWLTRHAKVFLVAYLVVLAIVLLLPSPTLGSHGVSWVVTLLEWLGVPNASSVARRVEFMENVLIILPVSGLASLVFPRLGWRDCTAIGFVGALGVETVQALLLPGRSATFSDVVANTLGALLGAGYASVVRWRSRSLAS